MPRHLFVVNHAEYIVSGDDPVLSNSGRDQAREMGLLIGQRIGDTSREILTSTARRAHETAIVIARTLGIDPKDIRVMDNLWNDTFHRGRLEEAIEAMLTVERDALIVVTQGAYTKEVPEAYLGALSDRENPSFTDLKTGEAWYLGLRARTITHLKGSE